MATKDDGYTFRAEVAMGPEDSGRQLAQALRRLATQVEAYSADELHGATFAFDVMGSASVLANDGED